MTNLGCYYAPEHSRQSDRDYIAALQPPVIRLLDPDVQQIATMHALAPNAIIAPRTWVIDDNSGAAVRNLMADPIATGRDHAQQYRGQLDRWHTEAQQRGLSLPSVERIYFNAANEPNQGGTPDKIAAYNVAFLDRCTELGIRAASLCLGVGWPDNNGPDTPVDWSPYTALPAAIKRGSHWLELHEYNYKTGPQDGWRWLAGRHLQCPFDVPILLGEVGIDNYVDKARWDAEGGNRGWQGNVSPDQYAEMIERHIRGSDRRVVSALIFITDYRNNEWQSFDTGPAHNALLSRSGNMIPQAKPPTGTTTHLPSIGTGPTATSPPKDNPPMPTGIIEPRVAQAILKVESGGRTHGDDGRVLIRFEAHIFKTHLGNDALWAEYFRTDAARPWVDQMWRRSPAEPWRLIHTGKQADEWEAFEFAKQFNANAAHMSISMGAPQIMGFNHARIGYGSAQAMFSAFQNAQLQTIGFINFFLSDATLTAAMRNKDWRTIALHYNGSGAVDTYSKLLQDAYNGLGG